MMNIADHRELAAQAKTQRGGEESADSSVNSKIVKWRGNFVTENEGKGLRHVFDDLQDVFGIQRPNPRAQFSGSLAQGQDQIWESDINFAYDVNGEQCNIAFVGIDVCVDLKPKAIHKHGLPMLKDYGNSWVFVYLPEMTYDMIKSYVKAGTGWDVSDEGTVYDPNRNLVAIEAKLYNQSGQPKPSFWVATGNEAVYGGGEFSRIGSVQQVSGQPSQQYIHRGVGIFSVSMEVQGARNLKPSPASGDKAKLNFTLVSVRTWGITDCVAPIVHIPSIIQI